MATLNERVPEGTLNDTGSLPNVHHVTPAVPQGVVPAPVQKNGATTAALVELGDSYLFVCLIAGAAVLVDGKETMASTATRTRLRLRVAKANARLIPGIIFSAFRRSPLGRPFV